MNLHRLVRHLAVAATVVCLWPAHAAPLTLVSSGRSEYRIVCAADAPTSVKTAAAELQRVLAAATGVALPIGADAVAPMICLGANAAARAAGLSVDALPEEAFRIEMKGPNLYILGRDTPDGQRTAAGGFSRGTEFGVYEFLERMVGVRWLMPGADGEEIPRAARA